MWWRKRNQALALVQESTISLRIDDWRIRKPFADRTRREAYNGFMAKKEVWSLLARCRLYARTIEQRIAVFTVGLLLLLTPCEFGAAHTHVDSTDIQPSVRVEMQVSGGTTSVQSFSVMPYETL